MIDSGKARKIDIFFIVQFLIFVVALVWLTGMRVTPLVALHYAMGTWLYYVYLKGYRLRKAVLVIDSDLTSILEAAKIEKSGNYMSWKKHAEKAHRIPIVFSMILLVIIIITLLFEVPLNTFKDIFIFVLIVDIMLYGVFIFLSFQKYFISTIEYFKSYKSGLKSRNSIYFSHNELIKCIFESVLFGLLFIVVFYLSFDKGILNYLNHYIAFSSLYLLSKLLRVTNHFFLLATDLVEDLKQLESTR